jgi:phage gp37-like protein
MSITAHYINGHKRQVNRLIEFRVIEGSHASAHLAETFFEVLDAFVKGRAVWCECMRRIYAQQIYALKNCAAMNQEYV